MCQLEQTTIPGQDLFPAHTGALVLHPEMQSTGGVGPVRVCGILACPWACRTRICVFAECGGFLELREGPKDAPECRRGWASQVAVPVRPPVSLLNKGGKGGLTGKIKDYEGKFKASSGQGLVLNEHHHSLLC